MDPADFPFFVTVSKIPVGQCPLRAAQGQQCHRDMEDTALFTTCPSDEPRKIPRCLRMPSQPALCSRISSPLPSPWASLCLSLNHTSCCHPIWTAGLFPSGPVLRLCSKAQKIASTEDSILHGSDQSREFRSSGTSYFVPLPTK